MILSFIKKILIFSRNRYAPRGAKISFSASGEDLIICELLRSYGIEKPKYLDIGAHHPVFGNNTYLFYLKGGKGVIVEPNILMEDIIRKKRKRDLFLRKGAGREDGKGFFFSFPRDTRSTFSEKQALEWEKISGQKPITDQVEILSLNSIISNYFGDSAPDLVSIDAEGFDKEIISGFNWKIRPKIFCVESIKETSNSSSMERDMELYDLFRRNNYEARAETPANTIFADASSKN